MDFDELPEEADFRAESIKFIEGNIPPGSALSDVSATYTRDQEAEAEYVQRCRDWQRVKYDNGWAGLTWPEEYGGRGLSGIMAGIFKEEETKRISASGVFAVGIGMAGPTLIAHGTDKQKERHLPALLKGEAIWCQLFSEPGAGSDLGGLQTSAMRDGDEWVISGQKVWTSGAQYSDWGILLTRSDTEATKHRGITYFLVDMNTPGVEVRPLVQITGGAHFNEVFLNDVRIPHENIVGEVHGGWGPMMTTLANERNLIGGGGGRTGIQDIADLARDCGIIDEPAVRQEIMRAYCEENILKYLGYRVRTAASRGEMPGPESSVIKLALSQYSYRVGNLVLAMQGAGGMLADESAHDAGRWQQEFLSQWGIRIGGGTDNIQRNTIGEKVLMLPQDIRTDKGIPFKEIPK